MSLQNDLHAARFMLDDLEAMQDGGWLIAAEVQATGILRALVWALLDARGPQPGLYAWLKDEARPLQGAAGCVDELRRALLANDLVLSVIEAHNLARRLSGDLHVAADGPGPKRTPDAARMRLSRVTGPVRALH